MDPILEYLLEFNKTLPIEYRGRYLIPPGGLAKMLDNFKEFRLNRVEEPKELIPATREPKDTTLDELYDLLD